MKGFLFGLAVGITATYLCLVYPNQTRSAVSQGVGTAASAISSGVSAGATAAQGALNQPKKP